MKTEEVQSKEYQEGHKAWETFLEHEKCCPMPKNPYHEDTPEHRLWRLGWNNNFNGI